MGVPGSIVVTQCVGPAPIVLLSSAEVGVVAPRPIVLYGPLMVFYGSRRILPWEGLRGAQRRITRVSPPCSHSLNSVSVLMRFGQIFQDLLKCSQRNAPKRIMFFKNRLTNILEMLEEGGNFLSFKSLSLDSLHSVLTRLGGIW